MHYVQFSEKKIRSFIVDTERSKKRTLEVFEGAKCPEFPLWQNGSPSLGIAAPEYLSVPGHEDCLDSFNPSSSFSTKCIPSIKPGKCSQRSWQELKSKKGSLKFCPNAGKFPPFTDLGSLIGIFLPLRFYA